MENKNKIKSAVAGTGDVGLSNAILLAQQNEVFTIDIVKAKVDMLNEKISPIEDKEITDFLQNKTLNFRATLNKEEAYSWSRFCNYWHSHRLRSQDKLLQH